MQPTAANIARPTLDAGTEVRNVQSIGALVVMPQNFGEVERFAERMAGSRFVPAHLRNQPGDCLAVCLQALRWGMDPFMVAQKTYFVRDGAPPAYEAQLVNAVVYSRAPLRGRLDIQWSGQGQARVCTVTGWILGDDKPKVRTVSMATIKTKNSPLWVTDPDQQLAYYATRAWARLYCPDVIMGVYTPDDEDWRADQATDVTPPPAERPASRMDALEETLAEVVDAAEAIAEEPPADPARDQAEKWANERLQWLQTAKTVAGIDRALAQWGPALNDMIGNHPDVVSAIQIAAETRKGQIAGGGK